MEQKILVVLFLLITSFGLCNGESLFWKQDHSGVGHPTPETIVASMSTKELVGQTFMVGYAGGSPSEEFLEFITEAGIGGVKVFGWNAVDLEELAAGIGLMQDAAAKSPSGSPLLVATDQEGGWVRHVKGATSDTPGNLAIGSSGVALDAYNNALLIGRELAVLGINMNFAPTVDVYTNPDADVIGPRAFSSDPRSTAFLSLAFYRGLKKAGLVATAKHFPGHGNTSEDSHGTLPVILDTFETIWNRDLLPYRVLIPEGLPAIMIGHLSFPRITGVSIPATLSSHFLKDILRNKLHFEGIIITDDMRMFGVLQNGMEIDEACRLAIAAGNDMIMISRNLTTQREVFAYLVAAADNDPELRKEFAEAATRIIAIKQEYFGGLNVEEMKPDPSAVYGSLPDREGQASLFDLSCRSVAVIAPASIPFTGGTIGNGGDEMLLVGQYAAFFSEGKKRFPQAKTFELPFTQLPAATLEKLKGEAAHSQRILFCLANRVGLKTLQELEKYADRLTVFSVLTPIYLRDLPWVHSAIATFSRSIISFRAGFAVLSGDYTAEGVLPVSLAPESR